MHLTSYQSLFGSVLQSIQIHCFSVSHFQNTIFQKIICDVANDRLIRIANDEIWCTMSSFPFISLMLQKTFPSGFSGVCFDINNGFRLISLNRKYRQQYPPSFVSSFYAIRRGFLFFSALKTPPGLFPWKNIKDNDRDPVFPPCRILRDSRGGWITGEWKCDKLVFERGGSTCAPHAASKCGKNVFFRLLSL